MTLQPGDVVGAMDCPCCGSPLSIKLNKNKTAYAICMKITVPETRERCGFKLSMGRMKSRELIKQHESEREVENHVQPEFTGAEDAATATVAREPDAIPEPAIIDKQPERRGLFRSRFGE